MERALGGELGSVRVHTGPEAEPVTRSAGAAGLTIGEHVWLAPGLDDASTIPGRLLIAHELAHVIQQRRGGPSPSRRAGAASEGDASRAAAAAVHGQTATVAACTSVGAARQTPEDLKEKVDQAEAQMRAEPPHKNLVGAAGEGAYMGSLTNRGVTNVNFNDVLGKYNAPHLDVISTEGVAQAKVRGTPAAPGQSDLRNYEDDFQKLVNPPESRVPYDAIKNQRAGAEAMVANRAKIQAAGAWPKDLPPDADVEKVIEYIRRKAVLVVPSDHVDAVRARVAEMARLDPNRYGLGPNPTDQDIKSLTDRIQSMGLTRKQLGTLETNFRAGVPTRAADLEEAAPTTPGVEPSGATSAQGQPGPTAPTSQGRLPKGAPEPSSAEPQLETTPTGPAAPRPASPGSTETGAVDAGQSPLGRVGRFLGRVAGPLINTALSAWGGWSEARRLQQTHHDTDESVAGGLGMFGGGLALPALMKRMGFGGLVDMAINLTNIAAHALGAPEPVTDATTTVASATPGSFIPNLVSQGARAWLNIGKSIFSGDTTPVQRQVAGISKGDAGPALQGYAALVDLVVDVFRSKQGQDLLGSSPATMGLMLPDTPGAPPRDLSDLMVEEFDNQDSVAARVGGLAEEGVVQEVDRQKELLVPKLPMPRTVEEAVRMMDYLGMFD